MFRIGSSLTELIFPGKDCCGLCDKPAGWGKSAGFCQGCLEQLVSVPDPKCWRCGKEIASRPAVGEAGCSQCRDWGNSFSQARALGYYRGFLLEVLHRYKYQGRRSLARKLARLMTAEIYKHPFYRQVQAVVPVPLYPRKLMERGFNQAELLAVGVAGELGLPLNNALVRDRDTGSQSKLSRGERIANVQEAFSMTATGLARQMLAGKKVLLIDDMLTTASPVLTIN